MKAIVLDMDGTIADLYNVPCWLEMLRTKNAYPYLAAKPMCDCKRLNGILSALQGYGYTVEVVSWLSKNNDDKMFDHAVRANKRKWLRDNLPCIDRRNIHIVKHGTNKWRISNYKGGILFDDERTNVDCWNKNTSSGNAVLVENGQDVLKYCEDILKKVLDAKEL